jgi:flagellar hook-associated protein 2
MATANADFITALGAGSGVNIQSLAVALAEAEVNPKIDSTNTKIDNEGRRVSGYAALTAALANLRTAYANLNDKSEMADLSLTNTHTDYFKVTAAATASPGTHSVVVSQLADSQRSQSTAYSSKSASINGGAAMSLTFTVAGVAKSAISISAGSDNLADIAAAINNADYGVTAEVIDNGGTSNRYSLLLTGDTGSVNTFSLVTDDGTGSSVAGLTFSDLTNAQDATFTYNGISMSRSVNAFSDVGGGLTFTLGATTPTNETARVVVSRDTGSLKTKILDLVSAYNAAIADIEILTGDPSDDADDRYSGSLQGDSFARRVKSDLRSMLVSDSSTPGSDLSAMWQLGLSIDRYGKASVNETTLSSALSTNYDDVVTILSADTDNQSVYGTASRGIAGDALYSIDALISSRGTLATQTTNSESRILNYKARLEELETKLEDVKQRYLRQFAAMESIVGKNKGMSSSLESSFKGLMASYTR